ncbi:hypothetical protein QR97_25445 [Streptomyces sp. PBH53]|nr:hypothetical protein QR97_25445 [Streptomyces sp. PBH53]
MQPAASEARKATASATSWLVRERLKGILERMASRPLSGTTNLLSSGVSVAPGLTALTRTLRGAGRSAREGSMAGGAPRVAAPAVAPGVPRPDPMPTVSTIEPPSFLRGRAFWRVKYWLVKLRSACLSNDSSVTSATGAGRKIPALGKSRSNDPNRADTAGIRASVPESTRPSDRTTSTSPGSPDCARETDPGCCPVTASR